MAESPHSSSTRAEASKLKRYRTLSLRSKINYIIKCQCQRIPTNLITRNVTQNKPLYNIERVNHFSMVTVIVIKLNYNLKQNKKYYAKDTKKYTVYTNIMFCINEQL